jgi:hypothetical protein
MNILKKFMVLVVSCSIVSIAQTMQNSNNEQTSAQATEKKEFYSPIVELYPIHKCPHPSARANSRLNRSQRDECYFSDFYRAKTERAVVRSKKNIQ